MTEPAAEAGAAAEEAITAAALAAAAGAPDARVRAIGAALVRHLHAFVREVAPSEAEWEAAIRFLTETGHMCTDRRQEFILLSDTLGVSMLVDAINHRAAGAGAGAATPSTVLGPFHVPSEDFPNGADIGAGMRGAPLHVSGTVRAADGAPLAGASVDIWHADPAGFYDLQRDEGTHAGRGRFRTDADGAFHLWTTRPSSYPVPHDGPVGRMLRAQGRHPYRPEHVHFLIEAAGHRRLVTHLFAEGDAYLGSDAVFGVKPALIRPYVRHEGGAAPDGRAMAGAWFSLENAFVLDAL